MSPRPFDRIRAMQDRIIEAVDKGQSARVGQLINETINAVEQIFNSSASQVVLLEEHADTLRRLQAEYDNLLQEVTDFMGRQQTIFGEPSPSPQYQCDVFMLMPFADKFRGMYTDHIIEVVNRRQLSIKRGDDFFSHHSILAQIWAAINTCKFVIAECTGRNPNVFYELGIAHTLGKPAILIAQSLNDIPFDLRHLRVIVYDNSLAGVRPFKQQLDIAVEGILQDIKK